MNDLVFIEQGRLKTNSVVLAREFNRPHKNVMQSLKRLMKTGKINGLEFEPVEYTDLKGQKRPMYEMTERGFLIAMPFLGGSKSLDGQIALVDAFLKQKELLNDQNSQLQKELQDFALECRYSEARGSVAGKALRKRRDEIAELTARKVELENRFQLSLPLISNED